MGAPKPAADILRQHAASPVAKKVEELFAQLLQLDTVVNREGDPAAIGEALRLIKDARLGAIRVPDEQGLAQASLTDVFKIAIRLAEVNPNLSHILRNHFSFVERALFSLDNPKYRKWLEDVRAGKTFGLGHSELGVQAIGSGKGETVLTPDGDGYRLNGRKYYSTGNYYSDVIYIMAQTADGSHIAAIIPADREGVEILDDWDGMGQKFTASGTTVLSNVRVEREEVIGIDDQNKPIPFQSTFFQLYLTSIIAGITKAVARDAARMLKSRNRNFYHAVAEVPKDDPLLQQTIGHLESVAYVAESSVLRAAEALERAYESVRLGDADPGLFLEATLSAAKTKVVVDGLALDAANRLFDVGGASAATVRQNLDRHWRNIRTLASHNPVSYKARAIGQYVLDATPLPSTAFF